MTENFENAETGNFETYETPVSAEAEDPHPEPDTAVLDHAVEALIASDALTATTEDANFYEVWAEDLSTLVQTVLDAASEKQAEIAAAEPLNARHRLIADGDASWTCACNEWFSGFGTTFEEHLAEVNGSGVNAS